MTARCYKGTEDRFGEKLFHWKRVEDIIAGLCRDFGYSEIRTPTFEYTEVFQRGVGETTDIVQKEMFSFLDRGGRSLTLKPELTAGVARAYVQHGMRQLPQPVKLYYIQPCFRAERPQAGRDIEFFQFGAEYLGSYSPLVEAEVMSLAHELFKRLGITGVALRINSLGCSVCREAYNKRLKEFLNKNIDGLCETCRERAAKNPLRVLDCKNPECKEIIAGAPVTLDSLDDECLEHFERVKSALTSLEVPFVVDTRLVRGLDYYTRTVFEFAPEGAEGAQGAISGGGRYDNLIESCGGEPTGAVGFGMGVGRLIDALERQGLLPEYRKDIEVFVGSAGEETAAAAAKLTYKLRGLGVSAENDTLSRSVKAQMKYADKLSVKYSLIIGEDEISANAVKLKNMKTGEQRVSELTPEAIAGLIRDIDSGRLEAADR
jgi:histidyl-tRNA synthetase